MMTSTTTNENRWLMALGGIVAILFGVAALLWPGITLTVFIILFCLFTLLYGLVELARVFRAISRHTTWWTHLVIAILSIGVGIVVFFWPGMTTFLLLYLIAFWAITVGLVELVVGIFEGRWLLAISGLITIVLGFIVLANPLGGALAFVMVIGVAAIVRGVIQLIDAFRVPHAASTAS